MPDDAVRSVWSDLPTDRPMPRLERRRVIGERVMLSHVRLEAGCVVPPHRHDNEQLSCVLSGRLRFTIGDDRAGRDEVVAAGEVLYLPAGVLHGAEALEETIVLDVFSPPSATTGIDIDAPDG